MARIKAFKGLRYDSKAGELRSLVCPPYDIISDRRRDFFIRENPYNIVRLELPKGGEERYHVAGETLRRWIAEGVLVKDSEDSLYVYEMVFGGKRLKGFVPLVGLEEFSGGIILPHEETLSKAKRDRYELLNAAKCNFSMVYSLYEDGDGTVFGLIDGCSKGLPDMEVTDGDGTVHRMWRVTDRDVIDRIVAAMADKKLYIADGHHRYETALRYHRETGTEESGYVMMMLVNMENPGLTVFPTHRIVRGLDSFEPERVMDKCKPYFDIAKVPDEGAMTASLRSAYDKGETAFALYCGAGECYVLTLTDRDAVRRLLPGMSDAYCGLDVSALHTLVLEGAMGLDKDSVADQKNLEYTRSQSEALEEVDFGGADCSFILNPTKVSDISGVAAASEKMPQKSTYFYPKPITGLVMNSFEEEGHAC